jgi:predicted DNA-binding protein (MmcQ/YjbR family)
MFAVVALEPGAHWMSFKCSPEQFSELIERPGIVPAPYLAEAQWVALADSTVLPRPELKTLLRSAREIVLFKLPKKTQATLGS